MREGSVQRQTKETKIDARVVLDGSGVAAVSTGVGFLDHMIESFAKHGMFDIAVSCEGDLHVDMHHTTEDVGIALGQCFRQALGDFGGLRRFGSAYIPMDEALSRAAVDLSNRPYLIWRVSLPRPKIGDMDTELFKEWFHAFAMNAGACVHVENLYGENSHHIIESSYKALARALREAVALDPRLNGAAASTKGVL